MTSTSSRYDVEKFDGNNDFSLWKIKMEALLGNLGLEEALKKEEMSKTLTAEQKQEITKRPSTLILSLGDKVLQEISKMKTT